MIYNFLSLCLAYVGGPGSVEVKLLLCMETIMAELPGTSGHAITLHLQLGACHNIPPATECLPVWQAHRRGG